MLSQLYWPAVITKHDSYEFEHGARSLTRQILNLGYEPYVVDAGAKYFRKEEWSRSNTFRIGEQQQLMIADKQSDIYLAALPQERIGLTRLAWGSEM